MKTGGQSNESEKNYDEQKPGNTQTEARLRPFDSSGWPTRSGVSTGSVQKTLRAAEQANLSWPIETDAEQQRLMQYLYPQPPASGSEQLVDWAAVNEQLRPKGVTLKLLWQEHQQQDYDYSYSQFCRNFRAWRKSNNLSMRRHYEPGEYAFVDFSGLTVEVAEQRRGDLCRRIGRIELHFCLCVVDPESGRLAQLQHRYAGVFRGLSARHHARQFEKVRSTAPVATIRISTAPISGGPITMAFVS